MRPLQAHQPTGAFRGDAVVMGGSAGGFAAFTAVLAALPADFALPILLVQHLHPNDEGSFALHLASVARLPVIEPCDKELIERGQVYTAPADYHMLVERNGTIALSTEEKVHWSRPSIDVLFESAARALGERVIAVLLSGASVDGAAGIRAVKAAGGLTIAQDPATAEYPLMPRAAIDTGAVDEVLTVEEIGRRLAELGRRAG
jgi:two-component system chemotaxis response regulator CheB